MAKKSKTEKKKKGPKGKKARAKAKLERQWGEEAPEKTKSDGKRIGRSRILSNGKGHARSTTTHPTSDTLDPTLEQDIEEHQEDQNQSNENDIDVDSHSSMSDDENTDLTAGGAYFSKLIKNIKASNKQRGDSGSDSESEESDDDDTAENHGRGVEIEESASELESEDDADDHEDDGVGGKNTDPGDDFFEKRFSSTSPLPEDTGKRDELIRQLQQTDKILVPHADPTLELQVSKSLVAEMGISPGNAEPKQKWKRLSKESYAGVNEFLKQGWEKVKNDQMRQKSTLSSLQSTLHPFLTRYTDCLFTPKSSAVR